MTDAAQQNTQTPANNAAPANAAAAAAAAAAPAATPDWTAGFNDDLKGYVTTKGFKTAADVAESYRNFEKLQGVPQDRILKLAEKMRDDKGSLTAEGRAIFERLGAPKDAKDYQIEVPKEYGDATLADKFRALFHEEGVSKSAAERIVKSWNEHQDAAMKGLKEQAELAFKDADQRLRKEWGQAYEQNTNIAKEAVRTLGLGEKEINALSQTLGHDKAMQMFKNLGSSVGEGKFVQGDAANRLMEPSQAQHQIRELMKDVDFGRRLSSGDSESVNRWNRLHQMAYPGDMGR